MTATAVVANVQPPPNPAGPANVRAVSHGAHSDAVIAPIRARYVDELRERFPDTDHVEVMLQAGRLARIEGVTIWVDKHGVFRVKGPKGEAWGVFKYLAIWERQTERWFGERRAEAQAKRTEHDAALCDVLARLEAERDAPQDAEVVEEEGDSGD